MNPIAFLRKVGLCEAVSFLVLLFVAMPLKYFLGFPQAVKVVGWAHGVLFVTFCFALLRAMLAARWPVLRAATFFIGALLPFGPFLLDRKIKEYEAEFLSRKSAWHGPKLRRGVGSRL